MCPFEKPSETYYIPLGQTLPLHSSCRRVLVIRQLGLTHFLCLIRKKDTQESVSFSCFGIPCPIPKSDSVPEVNHLFSAPVWWGRRSGRGAHSCKRGRASTSQTVRVPQRNSEWYLQHAILKRFRNHQCSFRAVSTSLMTKLRCTRTR